MATDNNITIEELQSQLDATELALKAKDSIIEKLEAGMNSGKFVPTAIEGQIVLSIATPKKRANKVTYQFEDGHHFVRLNTGAKVSSTALMRIANGGEATKEELQKYSALASLNKDSALEQLMRLAKMDYAYFKPKK